MLNHLVAITFACVAFASIIYIFYFNRLLARLLGLLIRFFCWSQGASSIWVHIGSVQLTLLSGRVLLKDVRYHSSNQTLRIVKVQIVWKYWLRRTLSDHKIGTMFGSDSNNSKNDIPCRVQIVLEGYEWFLYNRTMAYENILSQMLSHDPCLHPNKSRRSVDTRQSIRTHTPADSGTPIPPTHVLGALRLRTPTFLQDVMFWIRRQLPNLDPKELMPIDIAVTKGVILCGNTSTQNLLVAEFESSSGTFGITQSRSKFDFYKQLLNMQFNNVVAHMVENKQYADNMPAIGDLIREQAELHGNLSSMRSYLNYHRFGKLWRKLGLYGFFGKILNRSKSTQHRPFMRKAKKSLDEETPIGVDFSTLEYAIERKILQTPLLELCYYADAAGEVPPLHMHAEQPGIDVIGNGDAGPEWGVDMIVKGGFIRYGPWVDRQRGELQRVFFPPTFHDSEQTPKLQPGDERLWTTLRVFVELRDETTLQIPFREASKNWQWDGLAEMRNRPKQREHAVIRLCAGDSSSIHYTMPMIAGPGGYESALEVHLDTVQVTSSLNDIRLISAESCRVRCELPSPLQWNASRTWNISVSLRQPVLYLLRDHINMFVDLGKDWASGPPNDFFRFVPTVYAFSLDMHRFELNLYANDHNIIDKPLVKDDNAFVTIRGSSLHNEVLIPSDIFRPSVSKVVFVVDIPDAKISLSLPKWHTHAMHCPDEGIHMGNLGLHLDGSYRYFARVDDDHTEQLHLSFSLRHVVYKAVGWSLRYVMIVRENYFGSFTHFSTLYEYLERRNRGLPPGDPDLQKYRPGTSNMMQVVLVVSLENGCMILPAGIPGYEGTVNDKADSIGQCLALDFPQLQVYLRLHDYYMDFSLNMSTVYGRVLDRCPQMLGAPSDHTNSKPIFVIDGIDITANRMFGPLPRTVTYLCVWEIRLGYVRGTLSATAATIASSAVTAFRINFSDAPNAPAAEYMLPLYPDITFVKISLDALDVVWKVDTSAVHIALPKGLRMDNNNLGGKLHRTMTSLRIPEMSVKLLTSATMHHNRWLEAASIKVNADVDIYTSPAGWRELAEDQLDFVNEQDYLTGRAAEMLKTLWADRVDMQSYPTHHKGVYVPSPLPTRSSRLAGYARPSKDQLLNSLPLSDSDDDPGMTEADRDAFVAQSRSTFTSPITEIDHDMSGGDESDDDDVSVGGASDPSDWSESERTSVNPDILHYRRFTRHFGSLFADNPALWDDSPFFMTKDYYVTAGLGDHHTSHLNDSSARLPDNNIEVTVFRICLRERVDIRVTPLSVPILTHLQGDIERIPFSPELSVDGMLSNYLSSLPKSRKSPRDCNIIDLDVGSVHIHFPQRISSSADGVALCDIALSGIHVACSLQRAVKTVAATCQGATAQFRIVGDLRRTSDPTFYLEASALAFRVKDRAMAVECTAFTMEGHHNLAEHATSFLDEIAEHASRLKKIARRRDLHSLRQRIRVVRGILTSCSDDTIVDPLSAIQPSYLVQSGIPHELRTDPVFRFLYHLRDCLWDIGEWDDGYDSDAADLELLVPLLEKRMLALDTDIFHSSRLAVLEPIFPELRQFSNNPHPIRLGYALTAIFIHIDLLSVRIIDPSSGPASSLILRNLRLSERHRLLDLLPEHEMDSRLSFPSEPPEIVWAYSVTVSCGSTALMVYPHLMGFTQHIIRAQRSHRPKVHPTVDAMAETSSHVVAISRLELCVSLASVRVQAIAASLMFEFGSEMFGSNSSLMFKRGHESDMSHALLFDTIFVRARSVTDDLTNVEDDVLASLDFVGGRIHSLMHGDPLGGNRIRLAFDLKAVNFSVPRSALRLYRFVQDWRNDFVPGMENAMREIVVELKQAPTSDANQPPEMLKASKPVTNVLVNGHVGSFAILLQVMHGTWISWDVRSTTLHINTTMSSRSPQQQIFGLQVSSQTLSVFPQSDNRDVGPNDKVKLDLPPLSISGRLDGQCITAVALVEALDLKVKPSHWDTLMTVQQKFGQDFNDFLSLIQKTRSKQNVTPSKARAPKPPFKFLVSGKIRGFRIGLEGLSSTVYLECVDIIGGFDNTSDRVWFVTLSDLALSLAPRTSAESQRRSFSRRLRSAFVILDFKVLSRSLSSKSVAAGDVLQINVTKIHAVMQPSSIGQVGDFVDDMQSEILVRREQRAHELAAFKQKTQRLFQSFDIKAPKVDVSESVATSFLDNYNIDLKVTNVGVAFPLTHDDQLNLPYYGSHDGQSVRAFLFSIRSIAFGTNRGVTGEATMKGFSFQFVHRFKQSVAADFCGELHQTRNRLVYPEMTASIRSIRSPTSRKIVMTASVSGFILDLDSTIPDYVFSLIDVYRQGKDRVAQLSQVKPTSMDPFEIPDEAPVTRPKGVIPSLTLCGSLVFSSGKVRTYSASASHLSRKGPLDPSDEQVLEVGGEVFKLPRVSVWMEYRAVPSLRNTNPNDKEDRLEESSLLMFKCTIHSSQNTLRPTLLPFFAELVDRVEHRLKAGGNTHSHNPPPTPSIDTITLPAASDLDSSDSSSMRISFSLRIDQSKLELTCKPDVNVIAALQWDSGGFVLNVSPGARNVTFSGSVGGLTIGLRHGFLSEDCVSLDARNLAFSLTFSKLDVAPNHAVTSVSLILDTEFLGGVRFSRLQDILCFKAVWLDRIPMFNASKPSTDSKSGFKTITPDTSMVLPPPTHQEYSTILLVRIRQIKLDVDLGQSISVVVLDMRDAVLRTKLTEAVSEVSLSVGDLSLTARGNVAGRLHVGDCVFQTVRRVEDLTTPGELHRRLLELRMTSGPFIVALESEHQKLLHYRAEPLAVEIFDDWSKVSKQNAADQPLRLSFTIAGREIVAAATVGTIPQILSYVNKFKANLELQRDGASRDSEAFRATRAPQPDNPLSAVAEAMIHSARNRYHEAENDLLYIIRQHMSLRLELLRLIVFPRSMDDVEAAQFVGHNVHARLDRLVQSGEPSKRDIMLSFTGMTISRFSQLGHTVSALQFSDNNEWLNVLMKGASEATIVGLPAMVMHMLSEELIEEGVPVLEYKFDSSFVHGSGMNHYEDIYIALNVGLYSWLAVLRKNLTREMDQVKAASDWRNTLSSPNNLASLRRKGPEGSNSVDVPRSAPVGGRGPTLWPSDALRSASSLNPAFSVSGSDAIAPPSSTPDMIAGDSRGRSQRPGITYRPLERHIERLNMRQLGEATPNVMHPFFMKKAGFSLEDSLPQYVNEYATAPLEEIMEVLLKLYSRQLLDERTT